MQIDGVEITKGLQLWDAYHWYGIVSEISHDSFKVLFNKNGKTLTYGDNGTMAGVKTLFTAPPFVVAPKPDEKAMLIRVLDALKISHNGKGV
jgi:hypothetical protein